MAEENGPVEHPAVTGRPLDEPEPNTTFAERAAARTPKAKAVQSAENKAVQSSESKAPAKRTARKSK